VADQSWVDLDYVVPRYQGFTLGEFVYHPGGPLAARGYRRVIAPPRMQNAGDHLTDVGFRPERRHGPRSHLSVKTTVLGGYSRPYIPADRHVSLTDRTPAASIGGVC